MIKWTKEDVIKAFQQAQQPVQSPINRLREVVQAGRGNGSKSPAPEITQ